MYKATLVKASIGFNSIAVNMIIKVCRVNGALNGRGIDGIRTVNTQINVVNKEILTIRLIFISTT